MRVTQGMENTLLHLSLHKRLSHLHSDYTTMQLSTFFHMLNGFPHVRYGCLENLGISHKIFYRFCVDRQKIASIHYLYPLLVISVC